MGVVRDHEGGVMLRGLFAVAISSLCLIGLRPAAAQEVNFKIGMATGADSPQSVGAAKFVELMNAKSGGKIKGKVYLSGSLGSTAQLLQSMVLGTVHATVSVVLSSYIPKSGVFLLPFLFKDQAHFYRVTDDDQLTDEVLGEGPKKGLRVISIWDSGFREIWTRDKEIKSLADLKGLKLRVPEAKIWVDTFKAFDVNATPMSYTEVYSAMQQGVIDGLEQPIPNYYTNKLFEVGKYMAKVDYMAGPAFLIVSERWWRGLGPDEKKAAMDAAREARDLERKLNTEAEAEQIKLMQEKGLIVTKPDLGPFREAAAKVWKNYEPVYGEDLIEKIKNR
jgi:tripartite ATP-independent transporter DctP family solute receptor